MPAPKMKSALLDDNIHYCALCKLDLTSMIMARAHYQGKNHARNLRAHKSTGKSRSDVNIVKVDPSPSQFVPRTYCTTCQTECHTRDEYKAHRKSTAHMAKAGMAPSTSDMPEHAENKPPLLEPVIAETSLKRGEPSPSQFAPRTYCNTCQRECHTRDEYKAHRKSIAHMAKAGIAPSTSDKPEEKPPLLQPAIAESPLKRGEPSQGWRSSSSKGTEFRFGGTLRTVVSAQKEIPNPEPSPSQFAPRTYCLACQRECYTRDEYKAHRKSTAHMANIGVPWAKAAMALSTSDMPEKKPPLFQPTITETPKNKDEPSSSQFRSYKDLRTYCTTCQREFQTRDEYKVHMRSTAHAASVIKTENWTAHAAKAAKAMSNFKGWE